MTGRVKVGGLWKSAEKLSVKVGGSWVDAKFAYVKVAGNWVKWFAALIYDTFTRTTSGSLGSTTSGTPWEAIRGTWYSNGSSAQSDDSPTSYPIAAVPLDANSTTSASVTSGTGVAFWVTDSGSWWAATSYITEAAGPSYQCGTEPCNPYYYQPPTPSAGTYPNCNCGTYVTGTSSVCDQNYGSTTNSSNCCAIVSTSTDYTCGPGATRSGTNCNVPASSYYVGFGTNAAGSCADGCSYSGGYCNCPAYSYDATPTTTYFCYQNPPRTVTSYGCSACPTPAPVLVYNSCPVYCPSTVYSHYLRLIKSVGGVVSQATSDVSLGSAAAAIAVTTQGNQITAKAYSDQGLTTELGSVVFTAASPTTSPKSGIIKAPSPSGQGSTVDNFKLTI